MSEVAAAASADPVFVEADNAMGSTRGDVDDGFALAALLRHRAPLLGIGSVFGNTSEPLADRNNRALAAAMGVVVPHVRGCARAWQSHAQAVDFLVAQQRPFRLLALGPLTTVAAALAAAPRLPIRELVVVGGDATSRGRWPPLWPYEFNLRLDRRAAVQVFASAVPITVVPIDVGRRLLLPRAALLALPGPLAAHARQHAGRWFDRARRLGRGDTIRLYDLLAAARVLRPASLHCSPRRVRMHRRGWLEFCRDGRTVEVVHDFDAGVLDLLTGAVDNASVTPVASGPHSRRPDHSVTP